MSRNIGYPIYDADNHMYETRDALTKYLPEEFRGKVNYVEVDGRTKIMFNNKVSEMIPNPTFARVARPGSAEDYFLGLNPEGKSLLSPSNRPYTRSLSPPLLTRATSQPCRAVGRTHASSVMASLRSSEVESGTTTLPLLPSNASAPP